MWTPALNNDLATRVKFILGKHKGQRFKTASVEYVSWQTADLAYSELILIIIICYVNNFISFGIMSKQKQAFHSDANSTTVSILRLEKLTVCQYCSLYFIWMNNLR